MKALCLGRLARPDIVKPIGDMATCIQKWSRNNDRQMARLMSYIHSTTLLRLVGTVKDSAEELHLALYVDADFAGEKADAKSTSGGIWSLQALIPFSPLHGLASDKRPSHDPPRRVR